jgi:hypothetical protein
VTAGRIVATAVFWGASVGCLSVAIPAHRIPWMCGYGLFSGLTLGLLAGRR